MKFLVKWNQKHEFTLVQKHFFHHMCKEHIIKKKDDIFTSLTNPHSV